MKKILKIFIGCLILAGIGAGAYVVWTHYYAAPRSVTPIADAPVTTTNHKSHSNTYSRRQTSMPTECFDDKSPTVCHGNHDVARTEQNTTCNCETIHNGKTFAKQYNIKTTTEYTLGFGEENIIAGIFNEDKICPQVCDAFTQQIVNNTFLPREYFTVTHKCDDAAEYTRDTETLFVSQCKCMIADENHKPTQFDMEKIKFTEFLEDTPEKAVQQCNRWCDRLCNSAFTTYISERPDFEIPTNNN